MKAEMQRCRRGAFGESSSALQAKFLSMMDDDFDTAGAIAVLHEIAGEINGYLDQNSR